MKILLTGATGYIGGRLAPLLISNGHSVRCLTRSPEKLADVRWAGQAEIVAGDVLNAADVAQAADGVDLIYYLVHSIGSDHNFADADRRAAHNVVAAASDQSVSRIIYLGGLQPPPDEVASPHLASRAEVGDILLEGPVPTVILQAGVIIGSGSASFEMLRYLTERLPVMVTPKWVESRVQPIAVRDVLSYLLGAAGLEPKTNRRFDIAGPDVLTYREMMQRYARIAGLRPRIIIPVPVLTPWLSSHWVNIITPVPKPLAQPLIESLRNSVVATETDIRDLIDLEPAPFDQSVRSALARVKNLEVETRWSSASWPGAPSDPMPTDPDWSGGSTYSDERRRAVDAPPEVVWRIVEGIGGERGWYSWASAWALRGFLDRLLGGVGLRRGRRHPDDLRTGDALDFWRVETLHRPELLRLRAEMRLPGEAWLEFRIRPGSRPGTSVLDQRALFLPRGLAGHAYWRSISPFHNVVFGDMIDNICAAAEQQIPAATGSGVA
ncbi:MAG: SDR family oxidoreductase [Actinomycetota bacterium]